MKISDNCLNFTIVVVQRSETTREKVVRLVAIATHLDRTKSCSMIFQVTTRIISFLVKPKNYILFYSTFHY